MMRSIGYNKILSIYIYIEIYIDIFCVSLNFMMNISKRNLNLCTYFLLFAFFLIKSSRIKI